MTDTSNTRSAANLLSNLSNAGFPPTEGTEAFILNQQGEKPLPVYVRILVGVGALISAICFVGFLAISGLIFDGGPSLVFWSLIFLGLAIWLMREANTSKSVKHSFLVQTSFALMVTGKAAFVFGVTDITGSVWGAPLALFMVTCATYFIYRTPLDRLLSVFAFLYSILFSIIWDKELSGATEIYLNAYILVQYITAAVLLTYTKLKRAFAPIANALILSLCASVLLLVSHKGFLFEVYTGLFHPIFINIIFTLGLIGLIGWANGGLARLRSEPMLMAIAGALLLGSVSAPGIILSITLLVLGYAKHERFPAVLGSMLIPIFLWMYYYSIDVSLIQKSAILVGSGAVLLAGRAYLKFRGWDKMQAQDEERAS